LISVNIHTKTKSFLLTEQKGALKLTTSLIADGIFFTRNLDCFIPAPCLPKWRKCLHFNSAEVSSEFPNLITSNPLKSVEVKSNVRHAVRKFMIIRNFSSQKCAKVGH